ncbi:cilia- and flagella-associated protein 100-like [Anableps anableps]
MEKNLGEKRKNYTQCCSQLTFWATLPSALTGRKDLFNFEERKAELQIELARYKKKTRDLEKVIRPLETEVKCNQHFCDRELNHMKNFITRIERKPLDSKILFENAIKSKQESSITLEERLRERMAAKSKFEKAEDILNRHKCYGDILFKLSPLEWQEAKEAEILKAEDAQKGQSSEPGETADSKCVGVALKSSPDETLPLESNLSASQEDTLLTTSVVSDGSNSDENTLDIYFSDPFEVVVLPLELTDQILSLIENATEMDKMLEQTLELTKEKMKEDELKLTTQENKLKNRIEMEKKRAVVLRKQVQLHNSLKTQDQDIMLKALGRKVADVHSVCVETRVLNQATLEKLCSVEYHMTVLLQQIEKIPEDMFQTLWEIKENERKIRMREEMLRLERELQKEKLEKCMKRALGYSMKIPGRKLMPRCFPVQKKVQVNTDTSPPAEEDILADLFTDICD